MTDLGEKIGFKLDRVVSLTHRLEKLCGLATAQGLVLNVMHGRLWATPVADVADFLIRELKGRSK